MRSPRTRWVGAALLLTWAAGATTAVVAAGAGAGALLLDALLPAALTLPSVLLGLLVVRARPGHPAGFALMTLGAASSAATGIELWGATDLPAAAFVGLVAPGAWVLHLVGPVLLGLTFPDLPPAGSRLRLVLPAYLTATALLLAFVALDTSADDGPGAGAPLGLPGPVWDGIGSGALLLLLVTVLAALAAPVLRYRRGDAALRRQIRWLLLGAASVPALLVAGWVASWAGAGVAAAFTGFFLAVLVVLPATVAVAVVRHDVLDVDRLIGSTAAWALTTLVSGALFALVVLGVAEGAAGLLDGGDDPRAGVVAAAFVTALALLPLHRRIHAAVGRVTDRERTVARAEVARFVQDVRDGRAQAEEVEAALRRALDDPALRVLLVPPGGGGLVDLTGAATAADPDRASIPLTAHDSDVGRLELGVGSARRLRLARELAVEARLPIEVSRLQAELRGSRARLVEAAAQERLRLERDLHDGAQQQILAVGMRLRSAQRRLGDPSGPVHADLDAAVTALERTVADLRRLAHGVRPARLDDGLGPAISSLVADGPIPVELDVAVVDVDEAVATTAYFVVAESYANTLKHAGAARAWVSVTCHEHLLAVEFSDDGRGGAVSGFGLTAMRDRVAALGGSVVVESPAGAGTVVRARFHHGPAAAVS